MKTYITKKIVLAHLAAVIAILPNATKAVNLEELRLNVDKIVVPYVEAKGGLFGGGQKVAGLTLGVIIGSEQFVAGYGSADMKSDTRPDGDTVYEIGSITKVFTGILLAQAELLGEVKLANAVDDYLPVEVKNRKQHAITLLDLATHTSGLSTLPSNLDPEDFDNPFAFYDVNKLYKFLSRHDIKRRTRSEYEYSNLGFGLLGHILVLAAGADYEILVKERICAPLGMSETGIFLSPNMRSRLAVPYRKPGKPACEWEFQALAGAGALRSTADDMMRFLAANMGLIETPLRPAIVSSQRERHRINENTGIGLAWHLLHFKWSDEPVVFHNGQTGGYHSFIGFINEAGVGLVVLANTADNRIDQLAFDILKLLFETSTSTRSAKIATGGSL